MAITPPSPGTATYIPPLRVTYSIEALYDDALTISAALTSILTDDDLADILAVVDGRVKAAYPSQSIARIHNWLATSPSNFSTTIQ